MIFGTSAVSTALQGSGLEPQNEEFRRKRSRARFDPGVHSLDVGGDPASCGRTEVPQRRLRPVVESQHPQQAVGAEGGGPEHFGQTAGPDPPIHLHLPHPVLRMHETEREQGVLLVPGRDVRNAVRVPDHLHRRGESGQGPLTVDLRQRTPKPDEGAARRRAQHENDEHPPAQPFQSRCHTVRSNPVAALPAQASVFGLEPMDSRFRGNDGTNACSSFPRKRESSEIYRRISP